MDKKINEIATIITEKINSLSLSTNNYVSTENMLPNFNGITQASSIPSGNVSHFRISDILISNIRPYFRKIWFSNRDGGCSNDVIILRANEGKVLPKYLYYALTNDYFINYYVASCKGTKMPRGNKDALLEWVLDVPSREIQQHIVNTIGTVDDLIENLNKQYQKILDDSLRLFELFEGSSTIYFSDAFKSFNGGTFQSKYYVQDSNNKLITIKNVDDAGFNASSVSYLSDERIETKYLLHPGDVLLTMTGNIGRTGIVDEENCYLNQRVLKLQSKSKLYLLCYLIKYKQEIIQLGKGTAQLNLSLEDLNNLVVRNTINEIENFAKNDVIFNRLLNVKLQIKKLRKIKNDLLSKYF